MNGWPNRSIWTSNRARPRHATPATSPRRRRDEAAPGPLSTHAGVGQALRSRGRDEGRSGRTDRDIDADPAEPGLRHARRPAAGDRPVRQHAATDRLYAVRHQPHPGGRPGSGGFADDRRRSRAAVRPGQRGIRRSGHVAGAAFRRGAAAHGGAAPGLPGELPQPSGDFRLHQRVGHSHRPRPAQAHPRHLDRRRERRAAACRAAHGAAWGASADARHRWQHPAIPLSGPQPALHLAAASGHEPAYCRHADQDRPGRRPATGHRGGQRLRACRCRRAGRRRSTARTALAESANAGAGTDSAAVACGGADQPGRLRRVGVGGANPGSQASRTHQAPIRNWLRSAVPMSPRPSVAAFR